MQVFKNSRALLIRVSEFSNLGTQATHPDEDVSISYNRLNKKTMTQILTEHAESHDGKVLIPFGCNVRVENMHLCGQLFLRLASGEWCGGRILDAGKDWTPKIQDEQGCLIPDECMLDKATRWAAVDNFEHWDDFDFDGWVMDDFNSQFPKPVRETWLNVRSVAMIIYRSKDGRIA